MRINVGSRIYAERKAKKFSQADLERRCGLARCRISWLEHGRAVPTIQTLERIADALEIPAYRLLYDGDNPAQSVKRSNDAAANGNRKRNPKNGARLIREFREHMSRMREDDQYLLLFIARKMAGRAATQPVVGSQDIDRELDGGTIPRRLEGNS
jgi:transcriptional regulator with XRE-family HTH domain